MNTYTKQVKTSLAIHSTVSYTYGVKKRASTLTYQSPRNVRKQPPSRITRLGYTSSNRRRRRIRYAWRFQKWTACSKTCGAGWQATFQWAVDRFSDRRLANSCERIQSSQYTYIQMYTKIKQKLNYVGMLEQYHSDGSLGQIIINIHA